MSLHSPGTKNSFVVFSFSCLVELKITSREVHLIQTVLGQVQSICYVCLLPPQEILHKSIRIEKEILIFTAVSLVPANLCPEVGTIRRPWKSLSDLPFMLKGGRDLCFQFYEIPGRMLQAHSDNEYVAPRYSQPLFPSGHVK